MAGNEATRARRAADLTLAVLFVVGIALPCLGTVAGIATGGLPGENRPVAAAPDFSAPAKVVRRQALAWFDDHFGFRNALVRGFGWVAFSTFGASISSDVVPGREGWLFYDADRIIESRRGLIPFTPEELAVWQANLEARRDWLAARGIRYVFAVAPEKSSLYAEYLPPSLRPIGAPTRLDQLLEWMARRSTVQALDFRPALGAAKKRVRVYHMTDTHWNDVGAFVAYRGVEAWLRTQSSAVQLLDGALFEQRVDGGTPGGDLAGMMAIAPWLHEERVMLLPKTQTPVKELDPTEAMRRRPYLANNPPVVFACETGELGRAVVFHDSFFLTMRPWLARHFRRSVFLPEFAPEVVLDEHPDVVIEEMVERLLSRPGFVPTAELPDSPSPARPNRDGLR